MTGGRSTQEARKQEENLNVLKTLIKSDDRTKSKIQQAVEQLEMKSENLDRLKI